VGFNQKRRKGSCTLQGLFPPLRDCWLTWLLFVNTVSEHEHAPPLVAAPFSWPSVGFAPVFVRANPQTERIAMSKKRVKFPELRSSIRSRQDESRAIRARIHASSGMDRWYVWQEKRSYGHDTRTELLTYAMLRGVPYLACEKKCEDGNHPSSSSISAVAKFYGHEVTPEQVRTWLDHSAVQEGPATEVAA